MSKKRRIVACVSVVLIAALMLGVTQGTGLWTDIMFAKNKGKENVSMNDLSKAFQIILDKSTRDFREGYPLDESFLCWLRETYGDAAVLDIAYHLYEGYADVDMWYQVTGNSMHVLWLEYCKDLGYATYHLQNVHWKECASDEVVKIDLTGDINLADDWHTMKVLNEQEKGIYDCISKEIMEELQSADVSVINNEFVFSDGGDEQTDKAYTFRAKTENISMLDVFGADLANLANNHVYDYRASGLMDTIATLSNHGVVTMGAGANLVEAKTIQYYVANGKKIAFVSATEIEKYSNYTKAATETEAGVLKTLDPTIYKQVIAEASENSDYVIASVHWGIEGNYQYSSSQYNLAKIFVDAGADAVIGGHPHRLQGIEYINNVPVIYSLGNFWFSTGTLYTTIAQLQIDQNGELALRMIPCLQKDVKTSMLSQEEADAFYKFMADISKDIVIDKDGFIYNTASGRNAHLKTEDNYQSGKHYASYDGSIDLDGRPIDIVGNLR